MVKILDCTTRDGGHDTNWDFKKDFIIDHIKNLENLNIEYYEIGYRNHIDKTSKGIYYFCTPEIINEYKKYSRNIQIGIMADTSRFSYEDFPNAEVDSVDFVRLATHPQMIIKTLEIAENLHSKGYKIFIQLMEIPNLKPEHYEILSNWKYKNILESLYIADTYSTVQPKQVQKYFKNLYDLGYDKISFHAHNGQNLALENTQEAVKQGAYSIDVSFKGLGGNLDSCNISIIRQ